MSVSVHILCYNEKDILPYTLRHYATFADQIIVHDAMSDDGSREIAAAAGAKVLDWHTDGVNDALAKNLKDTAWQTDATDWSIMVDADELIYFPEGAWQTLASYDRQQLALVKPHGFEMLSEKFPTTEGQIYDEVVMGCPENQWYNKAVLFSPRRVVSVTFSAGAHQTWVETALGTKINSKDLSPSNPPAYLLHCHHLGPVERIAARYQRQRERLSKTNIQNRWGNFDPPMKHALDKRRAIQAGLVKVIA